MGNANLIVRFELFRGTFTTWESLFAKAAAFASKVGAERLIGIFHSNDHSDGVITVWYWGDPE